MDRFPAPPITPPLAGTLRIIAGLMLLAGPMIAGWQGRSPWIIAVLACVFALSFVIGRWRGWRELARQNASRLPRELLATLLIQAVLVSLFYLVGAGLAAVFSSDWQLKPFALPDLWQPLLLGTVCAGMAWTAVGIERRANADPQAAADTATDAIPAGTISTPDEEFHLLDEVITPANFFSAPYYGHMQTDADGERRIGPNAAGSQARIDAVEAQLGFALPERLREIYRVQNGGSVSGLCIPVNVDLPPTGYDDIRTPFGGYDDLLPTEKLMTAWESFLAFADPEDTEDYGELFTGGTERMLVLSQWYRQTLFLDYNQPGEPRVGWVDFDQIDWETRVVWWRNFDEFFAQLRRFQDDY